MKLFYLYKSGDKYYVKFKNRETGYLMTGKNTGQSDKDSATYIAMKWLHEGIPNKETGEPRSVRDMLIVSELTHKLKTAEITKKEAEKIANILIERKLITTNLQSSGELKLIPYLLNFWDYENSEYIREKRAYGHRIGKHHCQDMTGRVKSHWQPYFENQSLDSITKLSLKKFNIYLAEKNHSRKLIKGMEKPLSAATMNRIINAGFKAIKWAYENDIIREDVTRGIPKFSRKDNRKGILTDIEVKQLFSTNWTGDPRNRLVNLLAYQTGLRLGELMAIRVQDIKEDRISIEHSWSEYDGLKTTKNGEDRIVPLLQRTREELLNHARRTPHRFNEKTFIFWAEDTPDRPARPDAVAKSLTKTLEKIGVSNEERQERRISFHSWRHLYSTRMASVLDKNTMMLTGHKTEAVFEVYRGHAGEEIFKKAIDATAEIFGSIN